MPSTWLSGQPLLSAIREFPRLESHRLQNVCFWLLNPQVLAMTPFPLKNINPWGLLFPPFLPALTHSLTSRTPHLSFSGQQPSPRPHVLLLKDHQTPQQPVGSCVPLSVAPCSERDGTLYTYSRLFYLIA